MIGCTVRIGIVVVDRFILAVILKGMCAAIPNRKVEG
jgi:hypothetical protein